MNILPDHWIDFITRNNLIKAEIEIPEDRDVSGLGASLSLMDESQSRDETENAYPGVVVIKDGFVPVGTDSTGSGDSYFININDGPGGKLYRIYHDEVYDENYDRESALVVVLNSYEDLVGFK